MNSQSLPEQSGCCGGGKYSENYGEGNVDARLNPTTVGSAALPVSTNDGCCATGIGRDEVSGSNGSREIGGFGQMLTLVSTSDHGGVTTGCGCGPNGNSLSTDEKGQSPLRVNSTDRAPLNLVGRDDIANVDGTVPNNQSGSPECCVDGRCEECGNAQSAQPVNQGSCCDGGCRCGSADNNENNGEYSTGAGHERRHTLHAVMEVTR